MATTKQELRELLAEARAIDAEQQRADAIAARDCVPMKREGKYLFVGPQESTWRDRWTDLCRGERGPNVDGVRLAPKKTVADIPSGAAFTERELSMRFKGPLLDDEIAKALPSIQEAGAFEIVDGRLRAAERAVAGTDAAIAANEKQIAALQRRGAELREARDIEAAASAAADQAVTEFLKAHGRGAAKFQEAVVLMRSTAAPAAPAESVSASASGVRDWKDEIRANQKAAADRAAKKDVSEGRTNTEVEIVA